MKLILLLSFTFSFLAFIVSLWVYLRVRREGTIYFREYQKFLDEEMNNIVNQVNANL